VSQILLAKYAIEKYNSVDPAAIQKALGELDSGTIPNWWPDLKFSFAGSPRRGPVGDYGPGIPSRNSDATTPAPGTNASSPLRTPTRDLDRHLPCPGRGLGRTFRAPAVGVGRLSDAGHCHGQFRSIKQ
jgi:hypothetical protein